MEKYRKMNHTVRSTAIHAGLFLANAQAARSPGRSACGALVMRTRTS